MDQTSEESRERAVSSEPCSTRPNPFHDVESSRKRRRTSLNGSARSQSVDTVQSPSGLSTAAEAEPTSRNDGAGDEDDDSTTMKIDPDSDAPKTPERQQSSAQPASGPISSRVTINLRSAQRPLQTIPSSPMSPASPSPADQPAAEDDIKISVEETEVDMAAPDPQPETAGASPEEVGSSPRVDLLADDDDDFDTGEPQVTMLHGLQDNNGLYADPIRDFPYRAHLETWNDTITKVVGYLTTRTSL